ncbi:MAG: tetratricopeptide repeat protein [Tepidisphaeraceae bacterium]
MAEPPIEQLLDSAVRHHQAGRLAEAERFYRQIITRQSRHDRALHLLGVIAVQTGHLDAGVELIQRAIAVDPTVAVYHLDLGNALSKKGQLDQAIAALQQAVRIAPAAALSYNNLGIALGVRGRLDEAVTAYRQAVRLKPDYAEAHNNLGNALREKGQLDEAIAACRQALVIKPDYAEAYCNLGNALREQRRLDEAIAAYRQALLIRPDFAEILNNLGNALREKGKLQESIVAYRRAIRLKSDFALAHYHLALALLLRGDFEEGWPEYEWRFKNDGQQQTIPFTQPRWDGKEMGGQTILLWGEQGLGDVIQFVRYAPLVARRGGRVIIRCRPELLRLLQSSPDLGQILPLGADLPPFDVQCPLLSLPLAFGADLESIPASVPYLSPEPAMVDAWRQKLGAGERRLKVGLVWAGNARFRDDRTRSLTLDQLAPLGAVRGVRFYSFQKSPAAEEAKNPPPNLELIDLGSELNDFADTAAAMSLMDLIITTDTSAAHLAGALATPVWLMLQFMPDFRWLLDREDSPWYPTMRLFRQQSIGDWADVIDRVTKALLARR